VLSNPLHHLLHVIAWYSLAVLRTRGRLAGHAAT
jgi:hypothetical protein